MNILYVGDVMGEPGIRVIEKVLPGLRQDEKIDLVVAQSENVSAGKGITLEDFTRVQAAGVDFCTGGNWSLYHDEIIPMMDDPDEPIIRPANYPVGTPGLGHKFIETKKGNVLIVSMLGHIVGRDSEKPVDNPLHVIDRILSDAKATSHVATVVNLHGDYSSEKRVIGYYLDGRATVVVGDHWHVPSADAEVLPKGTAHITDVGMCGSLDSSLGVRYDVIVRRWQSGEPSRNELETTGRMQFNALFVEADEKTGLAKKAKLIQKIFDENLL
ncbi:MAG TPA: TIGR00282 family metallophosphoesterase [Candidatus Saccharimonadales bacterium]|nr:TIGR00282 family metallophosphoesterase [Candidatus Saccharimonadales bacterium]